MTLNEVHLQIASRFGMSAFDANSIPSETEVENWIRDGEREVLRRCPGEALGAYYVASELTLSNNSYAAFTDDIIRVEPFGIFNDNGTKYAARVVTTGEWTVLSEIGSSGLNDYILYLDYANSRVYCYPAGQSGTDKINLIYVKDIDYSSASYLLPDNTLNTVMDYASMMIALSRDDAVGTAQKYQVLFNLGIQSLGGR